MSFLYPSGSISKKKSTSFGNRPSIDSFDLQFEDSLDAALESLQINNNTTSNQKVVNRREEFELKKLQDNHNNHAQTSAMDQDIQPLISPHNDSNADPWSIARFPNNKTPFFRKIVNFLIRSHQSEFTGYKSTFPSSIELNDQHVEREIHPNTTPIYDRNKYPSNAISNAKYNPLTFIPVILYDQFKFFFNLYFLLVALSQAIPVLRIGYLSSYIIPLMFVLCVTMSKEAIDDIQRRKRDEETNNEVYESINRSQLVKSRDLKVGDLIKIHKNMRIPADLLLLQTSETSGEAFIKTDQLDGETDWKLRISCSLTQNLVQDDLLTKLVITASAPEKSIHVFWGKIAYKGSSVPLTVDNTLWANTVLASAGTCIGCVLYTGTDTRQALNTTKPNIKTGLLELEINNLSKILCICVFILSVILVAFTGFSDPTWYVNIMRYLILFSSIIPVSLRVNLDLGKSVYAYQIENDVTIPETIVRTSTIPEDLGRIEYLLTDKTGTLTQNDMKLKKIHLGTVSYTIESIDIIMDYIRNTPLLSTNVIQPNVTKNYMSQKVWDLITALAICHTVTPTFENGELTYQAASPDEIAIVNFTESVGLSLFKRDRHIITLLHESSGTLLDYDILNVFPFSSESKRMGIIVFDRLKEEYLFLQKGADSVMSKIVQNNDWLEEETGNMAREGLRTLVIARKKLSIKAYKQFDKEYNEACLAMLNREEEINTKIKKYLEHDLELLGLTGVEDKLQKDVKSSIELLRNAGVKIWMLTGDKIETARCVSISAKLISRGQYVHTITKLSNSENALNHLDFLKIDNNSCLLIDGESLALFLKYYKREFFEIVIRLPIVIACRCTPQQKADVALLIRDVTKRRVCCIGDGGNDVSMIQCADVGVGILGKEGKQASLAADFAVTQFCYLTKLLLWHGRNSYKRSAKLAQFVIHRGLIISICQAFYCICSDFEPLALYQGWLMVGYATCYTMAPVFSLTLDHDIDESLTKIYPELYKELTAGKSLSYKTFFGWVLLSLFQGCIIQGFSQTFTSLDAIDFKRLVTISFTALILNELIMVALEIYSWNKTMIITEIVTFFVYMVSVPFLSDYFDLTYITQLKFYGQLLFMLTISVIPVWSAKTIYRRFNPPSYAKVQQFSL